MMVRLTVHKEASGKSDGSGFCSGGECESEHANITHGKSPPNTPNKSKGIMSQAATEGEKNHQAAIYAVTVRLR